MNDDQLLFVYGSLLNSAKRVLLLGRSINASPARLPNYARGRKRFYFVAKQVDAITEGAILEGLTAHDLTKLDEYEEVPTLYTRERIEVVTSDARKIECWIYLPTNWSKA
jgi:gamma-glutamylcyclotransferase (GGCT)/AIG2-like uncharacterized protein YtfP